MSNPSRSMTPCSGGTTWSTPLTSRVGRGRRMSSGWKCYCGSSCPCSSAVAVAGGSASTTRLIHVHYFWVHELRSWLRLASLPKRVTRLGQTGGVLFSLAFLIAQAGIPVDLKPDTWVAVDGLGREVTAENASNLRPNRTVGIFYFLSNRAPNAPIYDVTNLLAADPKNPRYGPYGSSHWWGEPWLGYYQSDDESVIRKHMGMLANAGVVVLVFDNTNGPTYPDVYLPLCRVLEEMKQEGMKAPQIAFFTGHGAWNTLEQDFYGKGIYSDLWFQWKGKPLMMVHLEN